MQDFNIFHGSSKIIPKPQFGFGKTYNDYGQAFYCTEEPEMAKEWACTETEDGFVNQYRLHGKCLRKMDLCGREYHILNWLAILLEKTESSVWIRICRRKQSNIYWSGFCPIIKIMM